MLTRFRFLPKSLDWLLVLALALIDIVLLCIGPMRLVWRPEVLILLAALALAGLGWGCRRYYRRLPHLAHMALAGCFTILFTDVAALFNYLADGLAALPLWDHRFDALDRAMGLDWPGLYDWVTARPRLYHASGLLYGALNAEFLILLILLEALGERRNAAALRLGFCLSATATILLGVLMPAAGPFVFYDLPVASRTAYVAQLAALRDGTLRQIDLSNAQGLIFFPSFHAALGVLCAHAARAVRGLFWPALLFNLLIICTAPIIGGHYFVDIFAGLVLSVAFILLTGGKKV